MADGHEQVDAAEQEFRSKNQWHSFVGAAWGGLAGASFFGALMSLAQGLVAAASAWSSSAKNANTMLEAASSVLRPLPLAVLGGLAAFGLVATYMSQREATELRVLQDEHIAQQQAKCMGKTPAVALTEAVEYPQNCRADGKEWAPNIKRGGSELHIG